MNTVATSTAPPLHDTGSHPQRLGKYLITRVIGEGAMGTVYQALDPLLQRHVAVKAIRGQLLQEAESGASVADRFRIEAQAAGRLSHPGIVAVHEYGEDDGTAYIAMEYVRGHTLTHYMAGPQPLAEDDALSVAVQVLEALHHAHELGVWHRDIKPGNLIVTPDGAVKVTDFGIARLETAPGLSRDRTLMLIGSPGYIAPERYTGEAPDRRVDIFSCGVLLYQLLTGVPPFRGSASEVMYQVLHEDARPPSTLCAARATTAAYDAVVQKALARRPQERYATALDLRDALLSVARRPVSRRLKAAAMARVRPVDEGPSTPALGLRPSNVVDMPTQRMARPASMPEPLPAAQAAIALPPRMAARRDRTAAPAAEEASTATVQPVGQAAWPAGALRAVEAALTETMGPIAAVMLQRAAAHCHDLPTLLRCLASQGLTAREQQAFVADVHCRLAATSGARAASPPRGTKASANRAPAAGAGEPPVLQDAATLIALRPQTVKQAETLLLAKIGPIAKVIVRRALAVSHDRHGFFLALADHLRDCLDRGALLRALQRLE